MYKGLKICVQDGNTTITRVRECNAISGDSTDVLSLVVVNTSAYKLDTNRFSKEPLALATWEDDPQWTNFVRWIVHAIIYAEEKSITQASAAKMPKYNLFGTLLRNMFVDAINIVGNYGEIYVRYTESLMAREGGINSLNRNPTGPQQYPGVF
jgi:hypothetical protein